MTLCSQCCQFYEKNNNNIILDLLLPGRAYLEDDPLVELIKIDKSIILVLKSLRTTADGIHIICSSTVRVKIYWFMLADWRSKHLQQL